MVFINESGTVALILNGLVGFTGDLFSALLLILLLFVVAFIAFRIPLELIAIFLLPLLITLWAYDAALTALGGVFLIYLAIILTKNWVFK